MPSAISIRRRCTERDWPGRSVASETRGQHGWYIRGLRIIATEGAFRARLNLTRTHLTACINMQIINFSAQKRLLNVLFPSARPVQYNKNARYRSAKLCARVCEREREKLITKESEFYPSFRFDFSNL